jgi:predicted phosphodiesterase
MLRRIALFSDVHANLIALEAVLADIARAGLTEVYCLGDLVGYGPWPAETVALVRDAGIPTVRGNYDDGVGNRRGGCGCYYATDQARSDGAASYAFTDAAISDADAAWLAALPDQLRLEDRGARILLAHGSPRKINEYLMPDRTDRQLARLADEAGADVVCVGHVHIPYHRAIPARAGHAGPHDGAAPGRPPSFVHYVSSGSVGKPKDGDARAGWVELLLGTAEEVLAQSAQDPSAAPGRGQDGLWVACRVHRVPYDVGRVAARILAAGLPSTLAEALRRA